MVNCGAVLYFQRAIYISDPSNKKRQPVLVESSSVRATISFPSERTRLWKKIARQKKVSLAWVVREAAEHTSQQMAAAGCFERGVRVLWWTRSLQTNVPGLWRGCARRTRARRCLSVNSYSRSATAIAFTRRTLPGCPDLVFRSRHKVILVHGCFWHRHAGCGLARMPKSRLEFWKPKLEGNKLRDQRNNRALARGGWKVLTVWECQVGKPERLRKTIRRFLDAKR